MLLRGIRFTRAGSPCHVGILISKSRPGEEMQASLYTGRVRCWSSSGAAQNFKFGDFRAKLEEKNLSLPKSRSAWRCALSAKSAPFCNCGDLLPKNWSRSYESHNRLGKGRRFS